MSDLLKPAGIPDNWIERPSRKLGGKVYINPINRNDCVRVMPANLASRYPTQRQPYVIDQTADTGTSTAIPSLVRGPATGPRRTSPTAPSGFGGSRMSADVRA